MANGKTHARHARRTMITVGSLSILSGNPGVAIGTVIGWLTTPDLDIGQTLTHEERRVYKANKILGIIFEMYYMPYGRIFKHRSFWTHFPGVGSAIRLLYSFWWIAFIWPNLMMLSDVVAIWIGVTIQDIVHFHLDGWRLQ